MSEAVFGIGEVACQVTQGAGDQATTALLRRLRDLMLSDLVERDVQLRLALLAALAGEHLLLVGPPGTAKSMVARRLRLAFKDASYFERLLTRFSVPEELFGPLSIKGLEEDRYERLTKGYLPGASVGFLDEVFKANSAILNALLTLLNEREFDNGTKREKTPLISVIGASNELPEGEELEALFDRFLLRAHVGQVSQDSFGKLLDLRGQDEPEVPDDLKLSREVLVAVQNCARSVVVPPEVKKLLEDLRLWCQAEKIFVSDRRWRKVVHLLQVSALSNGFQEVSIWDCWLLQHCLWQKPLQRGAIYSWYEERVGVSQVADEANLAKLTNAWEARLKADRDARQQAQDRDGKLVFLGFDGKPTTNPEGKIPALRDGEVLYLLPVEGGSSDRTNGGMGYTKEELQEQQIGGYYNRFKSWDKKKEYLADPASRLMKTGPLERKMEPKTFGRADLDTRQEDLNKLVDDARAHLGHLDGHLTELKNRIESHLWVDAGFFGPASTTLAKSKKVVEGLIGRLVQVHTGVAGLPIASYQESSETPLSPAPKPQSPAKRK
jgi:MoxR-like ATPase